MINNTDFITAASMLELQNKQQASTNTNTNANTAYPTETHDTAHNNKTPSTKHFTNNDNGKTTSTIITPHLSHLKFHLNNNYTNFEINNNSLNLLCNITNNNHNCNNITLNFTTSLIKEPQPIITSPIQQPPPKHNDKNLKNEIHLTLNEITNDNNNNNTETDDNNNDNTETEYDSSYNQFTSLAQDIFSSFSSSSDSQPNQTSFASPDINLTAINRNNPAKPKNGIQLPPPPNTNKQTPVSILKTTTNTQTPHQPSPTEINYD